MTMIITTSWDDGHPLDLRLASLLDRYQIAGTFYIPRHSQLQTLSSAEVAALSKRFEIGAHTLDHLALTTLDDKAANDQINGSKQWVEDTTGTECRMFCPPLGKFNAKHQQMIERTGFRGFRSVEMGSIAAPTLQRRLWAMPTTIQSHPHRSLAYWKNAIRRRRIGALVQCFRLHSTRSWTERANWFLNQAASCDGVFHLWGHSWEIEDNAQWASFEEVLATLGKRIQSGEAITMANGEICEQRSLA